MNIKFLPGTLHRGAQLTTLSGEVLGEFEKDPGWLEVQLHGGPGKPTTATVVLKIVVGNTTTIIDGSVVPSNSLPEAPRALPVPRLALPDPECVEARLDQLREPFFYNDALEEEWEEDECDDCS